jgi:hypothetical protein
MLIPVHNKRFGIKQYVGFILFYFLQAITRFIANQKSFFFWFIYKGSDDIDNNEKMLKIIKLCRMPEEIVYLLACI